MSNPFATLLAALEAEAEKAKEKILEFADKFVPILVTDAEIALEDLASLAMTAVIAQAQSALSGNEKFGTAVTNVVQAVEAGGKTVLIQTAQTAVQAAFVTAQSVAAQK